jgi:hypothetical protein
MLTQYTWVDAVADRIFQLHNVVTPRQEFYVLTATVQALPAARVVRIVATGGMSMWLHRTDQYPNQGPGYPMIYDWLVEDTTPGQAAGSTMVHVESGACPNSIHQDMVVAYPTSGKSQKGNIHTSWWTPTLNLNAERSDGKRDGSTPARTYTATIRMGGMPASAATEELRVTARVRLRALCETVVPA